MHGLGHSYIKLHVYASSCHMPLKDLTPTGILYMQTNQIYLFVFESLTDK